MLYLYNNSYLLKKEPIKPHVLRKVTTNPRDNPINSRLKGLKIGREVGGGGGNVNKVKASKSQKGTLKAEQYQ